MIRLNLLVISCSLDKDLWLVYNTIDGENLHLDFDQHWYMQPEEVISDCVKALFNFTPDNLTLLSVFNDCGELQITYGLIIPQIITTKTGKWVNLKDIKDNDELQKNVRLLAKRIY